MISTPKVGDVVVVPGGRQGKVHAVKISVTLDYNGHTKTYDPSQLSHKTPMASK